MDVSCEWCVLSARGLCFGLITRTEESYRMWRVIESDLEASTMKRPWPTRAVEPRNTHTHTHTHTHRGVDRISRCHIILQSNHQLAVRAHCPYLCDIYYKNHNESYKRESKQCNLHHIYLVSLYPHSVALKFNV
jgi:hypothetical protein